MVTAIVLLSVFFVSGVLAACPEDVALFITTPEKMEALSGSCLQIPCNFTAKSEEEFDSSRETFGVWIKNSPQFGHNPQNVIFNSSKTDNIYPMSITGNLREKNCTTLFSSLLTNYTNKYYFRIENRPFLATASCSPLQITVKDSPPSPSIEISGDLREEESVTITCSALTPCPHSPPELSWNLPHSHNNIKENTDGTFTTKIQTTITLSDQDDGFNIICSASYHVNEGKDVKTAEERKTLNVSYAPKDTSVSISRSDSWVNLTCSSRANPPVSSFTWFKISKDGPMNVSEGRFYSFNATDEGFYYCEAINDLGHQTSSLIHMTNEGPQQPGSSFPWEAVVGGIIGIIVLICVVVVIWWLKAKHPKQAQSPPAEEPAVKEPATATEKDEIHYVKIDFSKQKPSSALVHESGQKQDTLYAEVKVSTTANSLTQTADGPECIYAQVKKT